MVGLEEIEELISLTLYTGYLQGERSPGYLIKAASLVIERRLKRVLGSAYMPHSERFKRESAIMTALAEIGLGPSVLICNNLCNLWMISLDFKPPL